MAYIKIYPTKSLYIDVNNPNVNYGSSNLLKLSVNSAAADFREKILLDFDFSSLRSLGKILVNSCWLYAYIQALDEYQSYVSPSGYLLFKDWSESQATANIRSTGNDWGNTGLQNGVDYGYYLGFNNISMPWVGSSGVVAQFTNNEVLQNWINGDIEEAIFGLFVQMAFGTANEYTYLYSTRYSGGQNYYPYLGISYEVDQGNGIVSVF